MLSGTSQQNLHQHFPQNLAAAAEWICTAEVLTGGLLRALGSGTGLFLCQPVQDRCDSDQSAGHTVHLAQLVTVAVELLLLDWVESQM